MFFIFVNNLKLEYFFIFFLVVEIGLSVGRIKDVMLQSVEEDFVIFDLVIGFKVCFVGCFLIKMENGLFFCLLNIFVGLVNVFLF